MAIVRFASADTYDLVQIELRGLDGTFTPVRLLVDSGFAGESCLVLSERAAEFSQAPVSGSCAAGALRGRQRRALVTCCIRELAFERHLIAIIADTSPLALPEDLIGIAGLSFLRQFERWGSQRTSRGNWEFYLER